MASGQVVFLFMAVVAVASLEITLDGAPAESDVELRPGDAVALGAQPADSEGRPLDLAVEWASSDTTIVEVDTDGRLVALAVGTATITAAIEQVSRTILARVTLAVQRVVVRRGDGGPVVGDQVDLGLGESLALQAGVVDDAGNTISARAVQWTSSDTAIVRVAPDGTITGRSGGTARLTVVSGDARRSIDVSVVVSVADLSIRRADDGRAVDGTIQLEVGGSLALRAMAFGPGGNHLAGVSADWTSSDTAVASVSQQGIVRANAEGATLIFVRVADLVQQLAVGVMEPVPGTLLVTIRPWAYVWIDGVREGEDQRRLMISLPPGTHTLRLENPAMITFDTTVVIVAGDTTVVDKRLVAGEGP